jgi:hypothetical protein
MAIVFKEISDRAGTTRRETGEAEVSGTNFCAAGKSGSAQNITKLTLC